MDHARNALSVFLLWTASCVALAAGPTRPLPLDDRIDCQRKIEEVTWRHTLWPSENPAPKPPLASWISPQEIAAKAERGPAATWLLARDYDVSITSQMLQDELDRMARDTRAPEILEELFDALGRDARLAAECLARPIVADRLLRQAFAEDTRSSVENYDAWQHGAMAEWERVGQSQAVGGEDSFTFTLPAVATSTCGSWTPMRLPPPEARNAHAAVWTGTEMIVWGGFGNSDTPLNNGARYSPAFDLWTPTSVSGAPSARYYPTAVWTGTQMVIWGGHPSGVDGLNSGGRYDPVSDSWTQTSTTGAPSGRYWHTAVWTGSRMIVWGGASNSPQFNTGGIYDPVGDSWVPTSTGVNVPTARSGHTAVWTGSEMVVFGGSGAAGSATNTGGRYTPASDSWVVTPVTAGTPSNRTEHSAVWTGTEMIVWGGRNLVTLTNTGGRFDPSTGTWTATSTGTNCPTARFEQTAVWTGSRMLVWGGSEGFTMANTGASYDPSANTWTGLPASGLAARTLHTGVWTGTEMIVWGGDSQTPSGYFNTGARYAPATNSWTPTGGAFPPQPRVDHSTVWTGTEMIVWGGLNAGTPLSEGARYDPAFDTWTAISIAPAVTRSGHTAVWTGTEMIVWGGDNGAGGYHNSGSRYRPATNTWAAMSTADAPEGRTRASAVWTGTEMIVWGGRAASVLASGGRYQPAADKWTPTSVQPSTPAARYLHTAVWTGNDMIVWGGSTGVSPLVPVNSGSRYSPAADGWTTITGTDAPSPRTAATSVWTGSEMVVWGGSAASPLDTGGRYAPSGDVWRPAAVGANLPAARTGHAAVWTGNEMIVWGGTDTGGSQVQTGGRYLPLPDVWIPTPVDVATPSARERHSEVWTGAGGRMLVWSGNPATRTGGQYCPCPVWFPDADTDGHGTPLGALSDCAQPSGYVAAFDDCDDADPARFPGNPEVCDGADNDCDSVVDEVPPPGSPALFGARSGQTILLSWSAVVGAGSYDVVRGSLATLSSSAGDFSVATSGCVVDDEPGTSTADADEVSSGEGLWYLVRGSNCGGQGSYDEGFGSGQVGSRDVEIGAASSPCP